jgi:uncharacterized protein (TIGR02145 family)
MKNIFTTTLFMIITSFLCAQAPQGIPYQAVMRNADGSVMASSAVSLTFMIHDGSATGTVVYQESHALTSNAQGLVSCVVGNGVVSQGNFANINWGGGAKFLRVMMGTTDLGTQQMLSVPYALYSNGVGVRVSETGDTLTIGGNSVIVPGISILNYSSSWSHSCGLPNVHNNDLNYGNVSDIDGNIYKTIQLVTQVWMAENLKVNNFSNGELIPIVENPSSWSTTTLPSMCYYNNDFQSNECPYGALYNFYVVSDSRNVCPSGWHVPTDLDWRQLEAFLGMNPVELVIENGGRGEIQNVGGQLKSMTAWMSPNVGATNQSGFSSLPSGNRYGPSTSIFSALLTGAYYWTSTPVGNGYYYFRHVNNYDNKINRANDATGNEGFSIRCVRNADLGVVEGCTNTQSCNYNAAATQDDGSCLYQNATCDDGNANTTNDVINGECVCAGTILPPPLYTMGNGVTDIDGNFYPSIIINGQEWMQKNLAVGKYRNGDPIPTGLSNTAWQSTTSGSYAIYNNNAANNSTYGKLYNWHAVNDSRGLCPTGWHVPSDVEWTTLINYLDPNQNPSAIGAQSSVAGGRMKSAMGWNSPNTGATNESGFTGLPGGYRNLNGSYGTIGYNGNWWSSSASSLINVNAWFRRLDYDPAGVNRTNYDKRGGFSVRCVRD